MFVFPINRVKPNKILHDEMLLLFKTYDITGCPDD